MRSAPTALLAAALHALPGAAAAARTVTPPSGDFGPVLVDSYARRTITLTNTGPTTITLGELVVNHPDFSAGSQSGDIRPGTRLAPQASLPLDVAFRPSVIGPASATLRIASDDPAAPEIDVPLAGTGGVPVRAASPDSIALTLAAGETAVRTISISNGGTVPLVWSIAFLPPPPGALPPGPPHGPSSPSSPPPARGAGDLNGVTILWDRSHGQQGRSLWSTVVGDLVARGAAVTESSVPITPEVLSGVRILWSQDAQQAWTSAQLDALEAWVRAGGGLLLEGDNPSSISVFNTVVARLDAGFRYASTSGGQGLTTSIFPHPTTAGITTIDVGLHQAKLASLESTATELVRDVAAAPAAVASRVDAGRVVALSDELLQNAVTVPGRGNRTFGNQIIEWLTGASWVSAEPASGSVPADSSRVVTLSFTTEEIPAGTHRLDATISSNELGRPPAVIPITMNLTGRPDIAWAPPAVAFGAVVVGQSKADTVAIWNAGEENLAIASVEASGAAFSAAQVLPTTLAPAESLLVPVTFSPELVGPAAGTLTVTSDDPDEAVVQVALGGSGQTDCSGGCAPPYLRAPSLAAPHGFRFGMPIEIAQSPSPIDAFVFDLEFDPALLTFADSAAATGLTQGFNLVSALEISPGIVRCAGFGSGDSAAVPAGSSGPLMRVFFEVDCAACTPGDATNLVLSNLTDDVAALAACCGSFTFADCGNDGDVNLDGLLTADDALCALRIVLNGQVVTSDCDVAGDCEVVAADVNCDEIVSAEDALTIYDRAALGEPPYPCFAQGGGTPTDAARRAIDAMLREARGAGSAGGGRILAVMPSPAAGHVTIEIAPDASGAARLRVVDVAGRLVRDLSGGAAGSAGAAGRVRFVWDGRDEAGSAVRAGIYFARLESSGRTDTRKVVLLR